MRKKKAKVSNIRKDTTYKARGQQKKQTRSKEKEKLEYRGIPCDSQQERYTLMWLYELEAAGLIKDIRRADSFLLFNTVTRNWVRRLKTKSSPEVETLLAAHLYTPDFTFHLTEKGMRCPLFADISSEEKLRTRGGFNLIHQDGKVIIETKGSSFRRRDSTNEKFTVDQKWTWAMHGAYVNLFICDDVFPKTWTPEEYKLTDKTRQARKIHWNIRALSSFLKQLASTRQ